MTFVCLIRLRPEKETRLVQAGIIIRCEVIHLLGPDRLFTTCWALTLRTSIYNDAVLDKLRITTFMTQLSESAKFPIFFYDIATCSIKPPSHVVFRLFSIQQHDSLSFDVVLLLSPTRRDGFGWLETSIMLMFSNCEPDIRIKSFVELFENLTWLSHFLSFTVRVKLQ